MSGHWASLCQEIERTQKHLELARLKRKLAEEMQERKHCAEVGWLKRRVSDLQHSDSQAVPAPSSKQAAMEAMQTFASTSLTQDCHMSSASDAARLVLYCCCTILLC